MTKRKKPPSKQFSAFDTKGHMLPMGSGEVQATMDGVLDDPNTELILVIARRGNDLFMPVLGVPSEETLELLETAVRAYRGALSMSKGLPM